MTITTAPEHLPARTDDTTVFPRAPRTGGRELSGARKAAMFLAQMTPEQAGQVLARMPDSEVERLTTEIVHLRDVEQDEVDAVMDEFHDEMRARAYLGQGGFDFAREMLSTGLGRERATRLLARLSVTSAQIPFSGLRRADVRQMYTFLKDEHPQIIALVLAHLPTGQASDTLAQLTPELQADVAHRIAVMDRTSPEVLRLVDQELARRMGSVVSQEVLSVGGVPALVELLNRSDGPTEKSILEGLESQDPELAEQVRSQMFVFEDITHLDDLSVQTVLRDVAAADLAVALKRVREDVREKVTRNLSERATEALLEEMELLGKVRVRDVEEAQGKVVQVIRALEAAGTITISRGSEDEYVD